MEYLGEIEMNPENFIRQDPFLNLLPTITNVRKRIFNDLALNGYCNAFPVIGWKVNEKGDVILIDGNTRTDGSIETGIKEIPVKLYTFKDEQEAIQMALKSIGNTRPKNDHVIYHAIKALDTRSRRGIPTGEGSTRERLAKMIGTSPAKVGKAFAVIDLCKDPAFNQQEKDFIEIIKKHSLNKAALEVKKIRNLKEGENRSVDQFRSGKKRSKPNGSTDQFGAEKQKNKTYSSCDKLSLPPGTFSVRVVIRSNTLSAKTFLISKEKKPEIERRLLKYLARFSIKGEHLKMGCANEYGNRQN